MVSSIKAHKAPKRKPTLYKVQWSDGSESFEPVEHLYDKDDDDEVVFNDKLLEYWTLHPDLKISGRSIFHC